MKGISKYLEACEGVVNSFSALINIYEIDPSVKDNYIIAQRTISAPFGRWLDSRIEFRVEVKELILSEEDGKISRIKKEYDRIINKAKEKKEQVFESTDAPSVKIYGRFIREINEIFEDSFNSELSRTRSIKEISSETNNEIDHPFITDNVLNLFLHLKNHSFPKNLIMYTYIFHFLVDEKIDSSLSSAEYFRFVRGIDDRVKDRKPQPNATSTRRFEKLKELHKKFESKEG
jgi:hypothetical protein